MIKSENGSISTIEKLILFNFFIDPLVGTVALSHIYIFGFWQFKCYIGIKATYTHNVVSDDFSYKPC